MQPKLLFVFLGLVVAAQIVAAGPQNLQVSVCHFDGQKFQKLDVPSSQVASEMCSGGIMPNTRLRCFDYGSTCQPTNAAVGSCTTNLPGVCTPGHKICHNDNIECAPDVPASFEVCDGLDNDCDGVVDNGNPESNQNCDSALLGVCKPGRTTCSNGQLICTSSNPTPTAEVCDGLDNDCDGTVDNAPSGVGQPCTTGQLGVCAAGITVCGGVNGITCSQLIQSSTEVCDGLDNDCDGAVDNGASSTCDDNEGCTNDVCSNGVCTHSPVVCPAFGTCAMGNGPNTQCVAPLPGDELVLVDTAADDFGSNWGVQYATSLGAVTSTSWFFFEMSRPGRTVSYCIQDARALVQAMKDLPNGQQSTIVHSGSVFLRFNGNSWALITGASSYPSRASYYGTGNLCFLDGFGGYQMHVHGENYDVEIHDNGDGYYEPDQTVRIRVKATIQDACGFTPVN